MLKFMRISKRMILGVVCSIAGSTLSFFVPLLIKDFIDNKKFDLSLLYVFPFLFAAQFILCAIGGLLISTEADLHVDVHLLTYGSFVAYVMLFFQLVTPVGGLFTFYLSCQTIKGSLKRINRVIGSQEK